MKRKEPRDYQKDIIEQVVNSDKSTLIQIPTGGGKTFIAYEIATDLIAKFSQQVLFVAPRENLVHQTAEEFKFARPHIVHSSNKEDKNIKTYDFKTYPLLISTLQTVYKRDNIDPDVIIIDETHFGFDGKMINKLLESNKHSRIIGLSATPYDKYGRQLQGFDLILDKYDMKYMIKNQYLVPLKSYKRQKIKGLEKIKITQGDYDIGELEQVVCNNHTIMEIAETTKDKIVESEKTIVFAVTIKHADLLAEAYRKSGFTARSLHSKSQEGDAETIDYFKKGYLKVLVSVSKLTTGFDVPSTDCAVIARPTKSQNLYKQMVGRILRLSQETNKTHAVLLDCGNVIDELGDPLAPIKFQQPKESDNKLKCNQCQSEDLKLKKIDDKSFWECQECGHLKKIKEGTYKCSHCGHYSDKNSKFSFTETKILLDCSFCNATTVISEFLGDEALVCVDGTVHDQIDDNNKKNWIQKIWNWADENDIPNLINLEDGEKGLPRTENELLNMTYLDLHDCELTELPKEIENLVNLTVLDLSNNYLTEIPKEVFNLTNLTRLSLSENVISTLPKEIGKLLNLRELYLDSNRLIALPVEIGNLINLLYLELDFNELTKFPKEIGNLVNLIELNFSSNELSTLPKEFFYLVNLVKLNLGNNQIIYLSYKIENLVNLTVLDLNSNNLTEIPREIFNLTNLTTLKLSENKISTLPGGIGNLIKLETINLQGNDLIRLPKDIFNLIHLQQLSIHDNKLVDLPKGIRNMINLKQLNLQDNELTKLPKEVFELKNLIKLNLKNNKLVSLSNKIGELTNLGTLNLSNNKLARLPKEIGNLISLEQLSLQDNKLKEVPKEIFNLEKIRRILLQRNKLTKLPKEIGNLTNLHELHLQNNALTELPKEIGNLASLRQLQLQNNALTELPREIQDLKYLEHSGLLKNQKSILTENTTVLQKKAQKRSKNNFLNSQDNRELLQKEPITPDEFENLFQLTTKKYLRKKEKSFPDPLDFEAFLKSEKYIEIQKQQRQSLLGRYELVHITSSNV